MCAPVPASGSARVVATAGLLSLIGALTRTGMVASVRALVPAWIGAAYFFTSSTSFANPAVTIGRSTDSSPASLGSVLGFVAAKLVGAALGAALTGSFHPAPASPSRSTCRPRSTSAERRVGVP